MTQPAFSRRIRALELWLGATLIDRSTYPTRLTPSGRLFRDTAEDTLRRLHTVRDELRSTVPSSRGAVSFSAMHSISVSLFPDWLRALEHQIGDINCRMISDNKYVILFIVCALLIFIGMWMDTIAQIILLTPVLLPVVLALGVDPVHFGIIFVLCCEIGFLTPPLGVNLFVAMRLTGCSIESLSKSALPCVPILMLALAVMIFFRAITLWMPD